MNDPRWEVLARFGFRCASCGDRHAGILDLASPHPEHWEGRYNGDGFDRAKFFLSSDFCVVGGEQFFVRTILRIPLIGADGEDFSFGVWSSLSKSNFDLYDAHFDDESFSAEWFSWLSVTLKSYPETLHLKSTIVTNNKGRQRPLVWLHECDHPLYAEQQRGITYERLMEIYAANGHAPETGV